MLTSITKYTKSLSIKILVGIIILPFIFWGMGDLFRGGSQNVVASIDTKKINTKEFTDYLQRLNFTEEERKNIGKTDLIERVLSEYIGRKVLDLEIVSSGVRLSDKSLANILKNNKSFLRDGIFSPLEYEEFILKNGISKVIFERNLREKENKNQLLYYLSGGIYMPDILIESSFKKDNQIKYVNYVNLNSLYGNDEIDQEEVKKIYEENKTLFIQELKSINYAKLTPELISGQKEYDESFFNKIDKIENDFLDGRSFEETVKEYGLQLNNIKDININRINAEDIKVKKIEEKLLKKIYSITSIDSPELINFDNEYYIGEVIKVSQNPLGLNNDEVKNAITSQIQFKKKLDKNIKIKEEISKSSFDQKKIKEFVLKNKLQLNKLKINGLNDNKTFDKNLINEIFKIKDNQAKLLSNNTLSKNFIIISEKTEYPKLELNSKEYEKYKIVANNEFTSKIFRLYDRSVNSKYNVELNNKVIKRIKNSF
jgi:peptidyl-prolyl cis-trans isomerase D